MALLWRQAVGRDVGRLLPPLAGELVVNHLQQLGNTQLVHAGLVQVRLGLQRLMQALGKSHGNDAGRLLFLNRMSLF